MTKHELIQLTEDTFIVSFNEWIEFEPTQFIMIETETSIVRKPFGLGRWNKRLAIGVQIIGPGTGYIVQQNVLNAHGPCGRGFVPPGGKGAMIATPACLPMAMDLKERHGCDVFIGSAEELSIEIPFPLVVGDEPFLNLLRSLRGYNWFLIVGSDQMEKVSYDVLKDKAEVFVSFNEYMACGIGACKGCAKETRTGLKHLCIDGPVLRGEEVWS
ncbi:oxidoreductase [Pseudothermotoga sp.]|uniref:iron-sulfur cluster-binding protein n=1 Tax=Pseudothermotoga sp. TaxID=2033661 RepID=UPI0031FE2F5C